jgi:hypothetical protein
MSASDNTRRIPASCVRLCTVIHNHFGICEDKIRNERGCCPGSGQEYVTGDARIFYVAYKMLFLVRFIPFSRLFRNYGPRRSTLLLLGHKKDSINTIFTKITDRLSPNTSLTSDLVPLNSKDNIKKIPE